MKHGIITATMFLDDPYQWSWEQIMDLKTFCKRFMKKYQEEGKKWNCSDTPILGDKLVTTMDTSDMNLNDKTYAVVKTKYQEVYANPKKFYQLDDRSPTELLVKQLILASLAPIKRRPLDALYILYKMTYDRICILEAEKYDRRNTCRKNRK